LEVIDQTSIGFLNLIALTFKYFSKKSTSFFNFSTDAENGN